MLIKALSTSPARPGFAASPAALRHGAAALLRGASQLLLRMSQQLTAVPTQPGAGDLARVIEFHAEAGAPEGVLYVDGLWVGDLPGVRRL